MTSQQIFKTLEKLVDASACHEVLEQLSRVCQAKQEHILENWQDAQLADVWEEAGNAIDRAILKVRV